MPDATAPRSFSCGQSKATCPGRPHVQHTRRSPACGLRGLGQSRCRWPTTRQLKHRLGVRLPRLVSFFDMVRTTCSVSSEICFLSSCTSPASTTAGDCVWSLSIAINSRARSTALSSDFASSEALSCLLTAREVPLEIGAAEADHVHRCQCQA